MNAIFRKAVEVFGVATFSRWLLPDGNFLGVPDYHDHRIVSQFCENTWLEFIYNGACSVHYDHKAKYMWVRTTGLNSAQRSAFSELLDSGYIEVEVLLVHEYHEDKKDFDSFEEERLATIFLTDTIAYRLIKSQSEETDYDY